MTSPYLTPFCSWLVLWYDGLAYVLISLLHSGKSSQKHVTSCVSSIWFFSDLHSQTAKARKKWKFFHPVICNGNPSIYMYILVKASFSYSYRPTLRLLLFMGWSLFDNKLSIEKLLWNHVALLQGMWPYLFQICSSMLCAFFSLAFLHQWHLFLSLCKYSTQVLLKKALQKLQAIAIKKKLHTNAYNNGVKT